MENRRENWLSISLQQHFSAARKEGSIWASVSKHKVPETQARLEKHLTELWYRATDKPNPGKDLILAAILLSGIIEVSL